MTLETIYYIGQTVAVGAILASLVAIWFQMRQSQKMERATAQREVLQRVADYARDFKREEADLFLLGLHDWDTASFDARFTVDKKITEFIQLTAASFHMRSEEFISPGIVEGNENYLISLFRTPGGQAYWAYKQHRVDSDFAQYLNARMAAPDTDIQSMFVSEPHLRERLEELLAEKGVSVSVEMNLTDEETEE